MSLSDEENLDIINKKEDGSDTEEEGSVAGSESGSEGKSDIGGEEDAGGEVGVDDEDVQASDIDESEGEGEGEGGPGGEDEEPPSFASGLTKVASASNKLLSNIQEVVSNAGKNVGAPTGSGEDLLSKLTTSVKMPSSRGRKKRTAAATTSTFEEEGSEEAEGEGSGNNSDEDDINTKLKKFDKELRDNYLLNFHPESLVQNYDEIYNLARVVRNDSCIIVDELHRTLPMLTKYEKSRVLGQRAKQINDGATPFVKVPEGVIDGYLIALMELEQKKIPFIIRRPLPNGGSEYWHLEDLEIVN